LKGTDGMVKKARLLREKVASPIDPMNLHEREDALPQTVGWPERGGLTGNGQKFS